ncbi:hypothetical protein SLS60_001255 [Paraconiothyrium brasiliense]|uniref:Phosphogluconate dehydrogenase NAD-binding putative C-terminal domain-containing protein n=1 Tax=Paraconiothyrium brasiliense TaxID=300254 RepID=A0ABR3S972_9PLEO
MAASKATVGVLSIGQMGFGIAQLLLAHGFHVVTNVSDRSTATQKRAKSASIECVSSDLELVMFLDGGIIGGPPSPTPGSTDWKRPGIPTSGPHPLSDAPIAGPQLADVLNTRHLDGKIGTASGLKCTFAALSKGFTALALQSFTTAASLGVLPQLQDYIEQYNPTLKARAEKGITGCPPKAYRWVEEMNQIGQCFEVEGGWPDSANVFRNVASVYEQLAVAVEERGGSEGMEELPGALLALTKSLKDGQKE